MRGPARLLCLSLAALWAGCAESRDRFLAVPIPLESRDGLLYAYGAAVTTPATTCDDAGAAQVTMAPMLLDVGTPLSALRGDARQQAQVHSHSQVLLAGKQGAGAGSARLLLCDVPILEAGQSPETFRLLWGASQLQAELVMGGDLLRSFSLLLSFGQEPDDPLCAAPPCLRIGRSDISTYCQLADRGEAVFPFRPAGGELLVGVGDNLITYPATRITLAACLEPLASPLTAEAGKAAACLPCDRLEARLRQLSADPMKNPCRLRQLYTLLCSPGTERSCLDSRLPIPDEVCPDARSLEDIIADEGLHDPRYQPSGVNVRLLLSTALPGLVLSRTAFSQLRGEDAALQLLREDNPRAVQLQLPGFTPEKAYPVQLGRSDLLALALLSRERQLAPCEELARSRRQRYGLPRFLASGDCAQGCRQAACLIDLGRDAAQLQRRCGYSGQSPELACDDHLAPVAAAVELDGPMDDVVVVPDTAQILRAANADLRATVAQVDGIIGVALLARLDLEIDYPGNRVAAHCRCQGAGARGCTAYRRFTYQAADDCSQQGRLCLPDSGPAPGAISQVTCR